MALETGNYIANLVAANPPGTDPKAQGDDHFRLVKNALLNCFAGFTGSIFVTGTDGGAANAYTLTPATTLPAYSTRMVVAFAPTAQNTGASTLNISALGVKDIKSVSGAALVSGDLEVGTIYTAYYNGTEFRLLSITKGYADQLAFSAALPSQAGNAGRILGTNGTVAAWVNTINIPFTFGAAATIGFGNRVDEAKGADIASAGTINLTTATGNLVHITGTTTITAITIPSGAERTLVFDGILTLTNGANLILPTGANIVTAAGDSCKVRGDGAAARVVTYTRANGRALAVTPPALVLLATLTPTAAANLEALNVFTSAYDAYKIVIEGLLPATAAQLRLRWANGGVVDTASNYLGVVTATPTDVFYGASFNTDSAGTGISGDIEITNTNVGTSKIKAGRFTTYSTRVAATTWDGINSAIGYNGGAISGFRFFWSTGANFQASGTVYVYGYANT